MLHRRCPRSTRCICVGKKQKKSNKKTSELDRFSWFLCFLSVFFDSSPPHPTKPPQKNITTSTYPAEPTSVACVLRSSNRCCRKARAKRNSELSTPATYGGRHQTSDFLTEPWRKEPQKKDLNSFSGGGVVGFFWGRKRFWGGGAVVCWLVDLTVTHFDSDFDGTISYLPLRYAWWNCPLWKPRTNQALSLQVGQDLGCFWVAQMLKRCFTHVGSNDRGQICNIESYSPEN